jgi:hypothetical protein
MRVYAAAVGTSVAYLGGIDQGDQIAQGALRELDFRLKKRFIEDGKGVPVLRKTDRYVRFVDLHQFSI